MQAKNFNDFSTKEQRQKKYLLQSTIYSSS